MIFRVIVDGEPRFESPGLRSGDAPVSVHVPVAGAMELRLEATDAGDGISCDMANWANAWRLGLRPCITGRWRARRTRSFARGRFSVTKISRGAVSIFFIHRYNTNGFLTTGYTTFGTAWHLWTVGEHFQLYHDQAWLRAAAPELTRVGDRIVRQTDKTMQAAAKGRPEFGLMPPGVIADWNAFAFHFANNAYYFAALRELGTMLSRIRDPRGAIFAERSVQLRENIARKPATLRTTTMREPSSNLSSKRRGPQTTFHKPRPHRLPIVSWGTKIGRSRIHDHAARRDGRGGFP